MEIGNWMSGYKDKFRCKECGIWIDEDTRDDNRGLCDSCYQNKNFMENSYL